MLNQQQIFQFIDTEHDNMLNLWQQLVNHESGSSDKLGVDRVQKLIKTELETAGAAVKLVDFERAGALLIAEIGSNRPKPPVLFIGHTDTVFNTGTINQRPFTIQDGKAYGPGVLDMKGGIVACIYAIKALASIKFNDRPIKILLAGDEETGHINSNAAEFLINEARGCAAAFNCETGFMDDAIVVGRKGVARFTLEVEGVAAHVGNDPENGRNAIVEIAHKLIAINRLTDWSSGTTVNVGTITGGTVPNATPDYAKVMIDVRFNDNAAIAEFTEKLQQLVATTYIDGTKSTLSGGASFKPMQTTAGVKRLFDLVATTAAELGLNSPYPKTVGGGSDSAYSVIAGVPTVCAMGVKGARNHSPEEYALVDSLFERAKLLAVCVLNLDKL